jgi:FAD synthetase
MKEKRLLAEVYSANLTNRGGSKAIARRLGETESKVRNELSQLMKAGLVEGTLERPRLTQQGRRKIKVIFVGGSFEIIHTGHLYALEQARRMGDVLAVVLARDSTIRKRKGREPVTHEEGRLALMSSLRLVDAAIIGVEGNIYESMEKIGPDVVTLGYDQYHSEKDIRLEAKKRGMRLKVVRLKAKDFDAKTSKILAEFI